MQEYNDLVPRAATTSDAFNAVAEPRRREILDAMPIVAEIIIKQDALLRIHVDGDDLREVGQLPNPKLAGYTELNGRIGWHVTPDLEAVIAGLDAPTTVAAGATTMAGAIASSR